RRSPGSMAAPVGTRPTPALRNVVYDNKAAGALRSAGKSWLRAVAGLAALGVLVLTGAASAPAGAATAQAAATTGHIYWANSDPNGDNGTIGHANLDGTGANQNFIPSASQPGGVAADAAHVYWTNDTAGTVGRANLDGTGANQSFITGAALPGGVA